MSLKENEVIRRATIADYDAVISILPGKDYDGDYLPDYFHMLMNNPCCKAYVYILDGKIVCNLLNEIWITTPDDGYNDAWTPDVFHYYTNVADYGLSIAQTKEMRFRVISSCQAICTHAFVLLSAARDLISQDYYELYLGCDNSPVQLRRKYKTQILEQIYNYNDNCTEYRRMVLTWTVKGHILLETSDGNTVIEWTDSSPIPVTGVGIKTGFGNSGLWAITITGLFTGYYCGKLGTYGNMAVLQTVTTVSAIQCTTRCSPNDNCLGINFSDTTKECKLVKSNQPINIGPALDSRVFVKCLNDKQLCLACLN
ncbi:unnamed protein product [Mytilus coruscus]|uniref:Apple domain-containing protein n=1 Tax=Mytilus coruscus TaxID=42192 RepID=A0A6J8AK55_MYTCO|nr:unnamed protein product [Mytilus coruscus]